LLSEDDFAFIVEKTIWFATMMDSIWSYLDKLASYSSRNFDEYKESEMGPDIETCSADTLSDEYKPEDVWIGHSYFLMQDEDGEDNTTDRLLYEIIPLLEEYVRDGVLTADAQETIDDLYKQATE
jgi:5-methylcytosine-specific restriction protein B